MTVFLKSMNEAFKLAYPTEQAKKVFFVAEGSKVAMAAMNALQLLGYATVPYAGWVQLGLGAVSVIAQWKGGTENRKIAWGKELAEVIPLMALGACGASKVLSVSSMAKASLISFSATTGVYWVGVPTILSSAPSLSRWLGLSSRMEADTDAKLAKYKKVD